MKNIKKLSALVLALILVLSLSASALADPTNLTGGEVGGFNPGHVDDPQAQTKSVNLWKEITAYNPDEAYVYGPEITYSYTITTASGSELVSITDDTQDHTSGVATVTTALPGIIWTDSSADNGVVIGANTTYLEPNGAKQATGTIAWTNADILNTSSSGTANIKYLNVDFSKVIFTQPGVYRYKITESATYTNTGVTDGTISNVRYLDVYVMRHPTNYTDGSSADQWQIYGYVCISPESVTSNAGGTTAVTTSTAKTNGFVNDGTNSADQYYTYNFTITKDLVGDNTMINHQFPMTVAFSNGPTGNFQLIAETDGSKSSLDTTSVASGAATVNSATGITGGAATTAAILKVGGSGALASFNNAGSPKVADGNNTEGTTTGYIKYIGIPNTTVVTVTEQNDNIGTTYQATVKEDTTTNDGSALTAATLTSTTGTMATGNNYASIDNGETATRTAATGNAANALGNNIDIQFTNTLAIISPTGVAFRVAPYVLMLAAGMFLVLFTRRRREEAEAA